MNLEEIIAQGATLVIDPMETSLTPDDFLIKYGEVVDTICLVAKSESGATYYPSSTAPKDPRFGEIFSSFSQIATDIGIQTYALIHGNKDAFLARDPNFNLVRSGGKQIENYVCPKQNSYWMYIGEIAAEIAKKTSISGVIIKDLLYPNENSCFCLNCRGAFATEENFSRDFSYDQIKTGRKLDTWQRKRAENLKLFVKTVVDRVHQEKKLDIIAEIMLDPQTDFFAGAMSKHGQNLAMLSEVTSHILLHLYPWSPFPNSDAELDSFLESINDQYSRLQAIQNSLFFWGLEDKFESMLRIKDTLNSKFVFFTEQNPASYYDRRSLYLDLGV